MTFTAEVSSIVGSLHVYLQDTMTNTFQYTFLLLLTFVGLCQSFTAVTRSQRWSLSLSSSTGAEICEWRQVLERLLLVVEEKTSLFLIYFLTSVDLLHS